MKTRFGQVVGVSSLATVASLHVAIPTRPNSHVIPWNGNVSSKRRLRDAGVLQPQLSHSPPVTFSKLQMSKEDQIQPAIDDDLVDPALLVDTFVKPALKKSPTTEGQFDEAVTVPDSDNMLSLATVEHKESEEDENAPTRQQQSIKKVSATIKAPRLSRIIKFAIPAMGVWLCGPILSMIDTSAVGLLSGTAQQAALNPAVSVTDYGGLLVAFMYTATTNLVASASEADKESLADVLDDQAANKMQRTAPTLAAALQLALFVGVGFGLALFAFSRQLLAALMGTASLDPVIFSAADRYVRIRSLGMPAAVVIGSAQSASLGLQDIRSPLYVLLAAAVVNAIGDFLFVGNKHPWIGGCAGAAWATVFSQYAALIMFVAWLKHRPKSSTTTDIKHDDEVTSRTSSSGVDSGIVDLTEAIFELTSDEKSVEGKSRRKRFRDTIRSIKSGKISPTNWVNGVVRRRLQIERKRNVKPKTLLPSQGVLACHNFKARDLFSLPPRKAAKEFWPFVIPVTTTAIGRISGYIAMSHVASSALGTIEMAAQAIIFSFFCCLTPICDSLNLTAQSFVPSIYEKKPSVERANALKETLKNFTKVGGIFGAVIVALVSTVPFLSQFFTNDLAVRSAVNLAIPGLSLFFALSGCVCVGEGMLLGQKDLKFLRNAYAFYFFAVPAALLRHKKRALAGVTVGVGTLWGTFSVYQAFRCCIWYIRMKQLQRRTDEEVAIVAE